MLVGQWQPLLHTRALLLLAVLRLLAQPHAPLPPLVVVVTLTLLLLLS